MKKKNEASNSCEKNDLNDNNPESKQPDSMNGKKKRKGKKMLIIILLAILLALLLIVLAVVLYVDRMMNLINYQTETLPTMNQQEMEDFLNQDKETMDPEFTGDVLDPEEIVLETVDGEYIYSEDVINILLVGQDRRPGESRARSDSMILCSFNKLTKELTLTSFMRDMYVSIPDNGAHKLNASFAWGGFELLNETIQTNFGIRIDGNFSVDFDAFESVIDTIGGVDVYMTATEANYIGWGKYSEGMNHLNGEDALRYSRIRNIGNADFTRTARQQNVINAIVEKCKTLSLVELNNLMEAVLPLLSTNMEKSTILGYAAELLPMVAGVKMNERVRIPADDTFSYAWVSDMSVLMPDLEANRQILIEKLYK